MLCFTTLNESHAHYVPKDPENYPFTLQVQNHHICERRVIGDHWAYSELAKYTMLKLHGSYRRVKHQVRKLAAPFATFIWTLRGLMATEERGVEGAKCDTKITTKCVGR